MDFGIVPRSERNNKKPTEAKGQSTRSAQPGTNSFGPQKRKKPKHKHANQVYSAMLHQGLAYGRVDGTQHIIGVERGHLKSWHAAEHGIRPKGLFARLCPIVDDFFTLGEAKFDVVLRDLLALKYHGGEVGKIDGDQGEHRN